MAWSADTQIMNAASVAGTEQFSSAVTLNPGESAHIEVIVDSPTTPTDEVTCAVYTTLDDATEDWDDTPLDPGPFNIANSPDPNKKSFIVSGVYKFRIGLVRDGSTDTFTCTINYRKNGISV